MHGLHVAWWRLFANYEMPTYVPNGGGGLEATLPQLVFQNKLEAKYLGLRFGMVTLFIMGGARGSREGNCPPGSSKNSLSLGCLAMHATNLPLYKEKCNRTDNKGAKKILHNWLLYFFISKKHTLLSHFFFFFSFSLCILICLMRH